MKMRFIKILDCTLRDGGYVNDWNFGMGTIQSVISRLDQAGIDIIEIGFLDERRGYDENRSILPDTDSFKPVFKNLDIKNAMILAMIDFGTCGIEKLTEQKDSVLDGIRVIFKKKTIRKRLSFALKSKKRDTNYLFSPFP